MNTNRSLMYWVQTNNVTVLNTDRRRSHEGPDPHKNLVVASSMARIPTEILLK